VVGKSQHRAHLPTKSFLAGATFLAGHKRWPLSCGPCCLARLMFAPQPYLYVCNLAQTLPRHFRFSNDCASSKTSIPARQGCARPCQALLTCSSRVLLSKLHFQVCSRLDSYILIVVSRLYMSGEYTDFEIECGRYKFKAHKVVICAQSSYFRVPCGKKFEVRAVSVVGEDICSG